MKAESILTYRHRISIDLRLGLTGSPCGCRGRPEPTTCYMQLNEESINDP